MIQGDQKGRCQKYVLNHINYKTTIWRKKTLLMMDCVKMDSFLHVSVVSSYTGWSKKKVSKICTYITTIRQLSAERKHYLWWIVPKWIHSAMYHLCHLICFKIDIDEIRQCHLPNAFLNQLKKTELVGIVNFSKKPSNSA